MRLRGPQMTVLMIISFFCLSSYAATLTWTRLGAGPYTIYPTNTNPTVNKVAIGTDAEQATATQLYNFITSYRHYSFRREYTS